MNISTNGQKLQQLRIENERKKKHVSTVIVSFGCFFGAMYKHRWEKTEDNDSPSKHSENLLNALSCTCDEETSFFYGFVEE